MENETINRNVARRSARLYLTLSLLVLAWKTAGWWGLDRWLLPLVGTPWQPGRLFVESGTSARPVSACGEACTCAAATA